MADKVPRKNANLLDLEKIWDEADPESVPESKQQAPPTTTTGAAAPPTEKEPTMRIQITGPTGSTVPLQPLPQDTEAAAEEKKEPEKAAEPPTLLDSAAFSTLRMFHEMGLAGDSEDIFDGIQGISSNGYDANNANGYNNYDPFNVNSKLTDLMNGDSALNPIPETANVGLFDDLKSHEIDPNAHAQTMNGIMNGIAQNEPIVLGNKDATMGNGVDKAPQPIKGGKRRPKAKRKRAMDDDDEDDEDQEEEDEEDGFGFDVDEMQNIEYVVQEYHETTQRREHDVKDMDSYKEITNSDLQQFEAMLSNTESLITEMIDICKHNGYGLGDASGGNEDGDLNHDDRTDYGIREDALHRNVATYRQYVEQQLGQYNFNLSSNAIVDLMGVKHTMAFRMKIPYKQPTDCCISSQGYVLYKNKRLTPHYYFNVVDYRVRRRIDVTICKIIRDYLRSGHFEMQQFMYPSAYMLKGITPILIDHFEEQCKIFYREPHRLMMLKKQMVDNPYDIDLRMEMDHEDMFCVIVFPNHKAHIEPGIWSRSVTYFDNVIRGTMFQFIENVTSVSSGNGWGCVLLNPNQREIESESFVTKTKYDDPASAKDTETITIPRNESSFAHVMEMYKHFIIPHVIQNWKCKLLLVSHCDGGNDIIHLLETQPDSHQHIIGIAMLDFYNWSLNQFSKKTRQIIEQKAAIYMSLYGSNQSAYGLEPSAAKSPVTIFRTANKEKRYSPCYNTESVIRFFKSKIELNKQN